MSGDVRWIPVRAAARMLGCSRQRVHKLCQYGQLACLKIEGTVLVSLEAVQARVKASQLEMEV